MLVARLLVTAVLCTGATGCTAASSGPAAPTPSAVAASVTTVPTPDPLRHPCAALPAADASRILGVRVRARRVHDQLSSSTMTCHYVAARTSAGRVSLDVRSSADPTPIGRLVGLYIGTDHLLHHPVGVPGTDAAEAIQLPAAGEVTLIVKQGFVTHLLVLTRPGPARAERQATALAAALVAADSAGGS